MPANDDFTISIKTFLFCFHQLCKKTFVMLAHNSGVEAITTHAGLIDATSEYENYWIVIDNTTQKISII